MVRHHTPNVDQARRVVVFVKTAAGGEICSLLLQFSRAVECSVTNAEIVATEMQRLRQEMDVAKATKKDQRVVSRARVCTGEEELKIMREREAGKGKKE